jgi:acyl-CoA reductase-like NAD-dependent aldehyde dehydrogenase
MHAVQLFIQGVDAPARKLGSFERRNPVTGDVTTRAAAADVEDASAAVNAAAQAFPAWAALGPGTRRQHLWSAAQMLKERGVEFVRRMRAETGATQGWAQFNVQFASMLLEEAAALTTQIEGAIVPSNHAGTIALAMRCPVGVVVGMAPWNAPLILGVRAIAVPLACGNTVVLKASEICPATHVLIGQVLHEAGLPAGVVNVITHAAEAAPQVVEALVAHPAVRRVNFTGSTRVGRVVGELCGKHLKRAVLELGGKAPLVILDDADLELAVDAAAFGAFMHQGQICMSTERIVVDQKVADAFVERLRAKVESLSFAKHSDEAAPLGAVVDLSTCRRMRGLIADALDAGAKLVCGGGGEGVFFDPTILDHVTPEMKIFHEESFGPVVGVVRVTDTEQAIAVANDSEYGLSAAVFGRDLARALGVAQRIDSGICHVNSPTVQDEPQMPFGGRKASGVGRFGGQEGVHEFTDLRWLSIATQPRRYPF